MNDVEKLIEKEMQLLAIEIEARDNATKFAKMMLEREQQRLIELEAPFDEKIAIHEAKIKELVISEAKSFKCEYGKATFTKGYERATWDDKALMGYSVAYPSVLNFRKTTTIEPRVSIKIGE